ncbi:MAG: hypothetical protein R2711_15780 [Acidimicrobiales bacterium]
MPWRRSWPPPPRCGELGDDLVIGPFLGRASWRRASEVWIDPDLSDPELCFELADRLGAYLMAVELRRR